MFFFFWAQPMRMNPELIFKGPINFNERPQWTLVAQPFHPVFIDAVSQIIKTSQLIRGGMPDPGALDYTGPSML